MAIGSPPDSAEVQSVVVSFLVDDLGWEGDPTALRGADPLRLTQVLDSQDLLELTGFVEERFNVEIADAEINADTFQTLVSLADLVVAKAAHPSS